ncbi:MAG: uracil-DNA glycosylase [Chloroflexi bacterium]|nr:uracil-DNA glycosylase [Chloroflexota bacterium]MBI3040110.1 uracil-DNA glycosylase [Chloroflexota bacterium]MBI3930892.1 uracil-DNA glycosylase [Chloroflexota bacterium]
MSALGELYKEIAVCQRCGLFKHRTKAVPGEGPEDAEIMFIGEAPGWYEDQQGRPFVGPAGQYLDELLASIGLKREQVYIANVIKSRPPQNRDPLPSEIAACRPWLERQIEIIRPRMIVTLGRYSMAMFFPGKSIGKIHGTAQKQDNIVYYAMYHPAAALHQQGLRQTIGADMLKIPALLVEAKSMTEAAPQPEQLKMFEV